MREEDGCPGHLGDPGLDHDGLAQAGGGAVVDLDTCHDEDRALASQSAHIEAVVGQELGPAALHVLEVVGIVDHVAAVGVLVVDLGFDGVHGIECSC